MSAIVEIERLWEVGDANAEPCKMCEELIYSKTYTFFIVIDGKRKLDCGICVCNSCYEILKENNAL